jgi:drug/metabolite transporter (DMT)-like permease
MMRRHDRLDAAAMALMVVLCAAWGLQQVAIKVANSGVSPLLQGGLRSAGAAALLWVWAAWRGIRLFSRDGSLIAGLTVGGLFAAEFCLVYWGLSYTTASRAVLLLYTAPFVVALGAHLLLPGEALGWRQTTGLVCAFAGVAAAFGESFLVAGPTLLGDAMMLGAAVLWGATTVMIKASRLATLPAAKTLFYQLAVSAVALPLASWLRGEPGLFAPTPLVLACLAYQTVGVAFVSYLAWFWLVTRYPASRLSAFSFLTPLFGVLAGGILLGEPVSTTLMVALTLVAAGIWLVNAAPRPTRQPARQTASSPAEPEGAARGHSAADRAQSGRG